MKILKPQKLGLIARVFENDGQAYLVLTAVGFFPFAAPKKLLHEVELWRAAAEQVSPAGALDAGMTKHRGEVLVSGKAFTKDGVPAPATSVRLRIASVDKELHVVGDRVWQAGGASEPVPFTEMPITWERAFGGEGFAENPTGRGARPAEVNGRKVHPLPNIESPGARVRSPADRPPPAGLGPLDPTWPKRMQYVGTYGDEWLKTRYPGFAKDLRWEYFNVAPEDQRIEGYFDLAAPFRVEGMSPARRVTESALPGVTARLFAVTRGEGDALREAAARLDTVHLFPAIERGAVIFRGMLPIEEDDGADVLQVIAAFEDPSQPRDVEHYRAVRDRRLDRKNGALYTLVDDDLMPGWGEPEGAPPDDWNDMAEIAATEGLRVSYAQRQSDHRLAEARRALVARGLDPADFDRKIQKPRPAPTKIEELPAYLEEMEKERDLLTAQAKTRQEEAAARARERCRQVGLDFDRLVEERKAKAGGPPGLSADREMERLRDRARLLRDAGTPSPGLEATLADPAFEARLRSAEVRLREAYRRSAHLFPEARDASPEASAQIRAEVLSAKARGESLAGRDFTGADLSGLDLSGVDLTCALLEKVKLAGAVLTGADLRDATLARADLRGARLSGAALAGCNLGKADVRDADLAGADLTGAVFYEADLRGTSLARCHLQRAMVHGAKVQGVDLRGADARELFFLETSLAGDRIQGANLEKAMFLRCDLEAADFSGASLSMATFVACTCDGAIFAGADLTGARFTMATSVAYGDFRGARMKRTLFRGAGLAKADLSGVSAPECDFSEADLSGADLHGLSAPRSLFVRTSLRGADLKSANLMLGILQKAQLHGADLRGANLFRADMAKVRGDEGTRMDGAHTVQVRVVPEKNASRVVR